MADLWQITALVEARDLWASELGTLDVVTRSITRGQLVMPRISAPSQQTALRNHPSWEKDEDATRALGPVIAKWLASRFASALWCCPQGYSAVLPAQNGRPLC